MGYKSTAGAARIVLMLAFLFHFGCGDSGSTGPSDDDDYLDITNSGTWTLTWGQQDRTFEYGYACATINQDGSISMFFFASDLESYPLAVAGVPAIDGVPLDVYTPCAMSIMMGPELVDTAVSPFDPLVTEVIFTAKTIVHGGKVSGEFRGKLATADTELRETVIIVTAEFENVVIGGEL